MGKNTINSLNSYQYMQYSRQMLLEDISEKGQLTLMNSRAIIVGVGGLGQLVAHYLAAAGIGELVLIDGDKIDVSNLPRQLLFSHLDVGKQKCHVAKAVLNEKCPDVLINVLDMYLSEDNTTTIAPIFSTHADRTVVFDCTDNFESRHLLNQLVVKYQLTLISGAIAGNQGQFFGIDTQKIAQSEYGCYHCLYPSNMQVNQNCTLVGVLGPAVGTIASMQALAGINHLLNRGFEYGKLHRFDAKRLAWTSVTMTKDPQCPVCQHNPVGNHPQKAAYSEQSKAKASHLTRRQNDIGYA